VSEASLDQKKIQGYGVYGIYGTSNAALFMAMRMVSIASWDSTMNGKQRSAHNCAEYAKQPLFNEDSWLDMGRSLLSDSTAALRGDMLPGPWLALFRKGHLCYCNNENKNGVRKKFRSRLWRHWPRESGRAASATNCGPQCSTKGNSGVESHDIQLPYLNAAEATACARQIA
jgi:hypothetical protein